MERKVSKTTTKVSTTKRSAKVTPGAKTVPKSKVTFKDRLDNAKKAVVVQFNNIKKRLGFKSKKAKKLTKTERKLERQKKIRGIIGIGLLFVVVSIAYSTYMTVLFVDGTEMVVALTPQVVFAIITLFIAFYKLFK